jgi:hypothetical protein
MLFLWNILYRLENLEKQIQKQGLRYKHEINCLIHHSIYDQLVHG